MATDEHDKNAWICFKMLIRFWILVGSVERKLQILPTIIHSVGHERFGGKDKKRHTKEEAESQRVVAQIRKELRILQNR